MISARFLAKEAPARNQHACLSNRGRMKRTNALHGSMCLSAYHYIVLALRQVLLISELTCENECMQTACKEHARQNNQLANMQVTAMKQA